MMKLIMPSDLLEGLVHPVLIELLDELGAVWDYWRVTSLYREGDAGVHGTMPVRGIDIRCRDQAVGEAIAAQINRSWRYDVRRPSIEVAMAHNAGSGWHLHLQVHERTQRR